jgi:NAD(P)-dependent dehydrogenase (short-subunit alcohol dehydrogenase family)
MGRGLGPKVEGQPPSRVEIARGMIAMTRGLARELGDHGVTVNAVAPGFTLTEASRAVTDNAETGE